MDTVTSSLLSPVTKAHFKKWHSEGALLLLAAGYGQLDDLVKSTSDYGTDYKALGKPVTRADVDGKQHNIYMFSNGCDEFIVVVYASDTYPKTHLTVYVCK